MKEEVRDYYWRIRQKVFVCLFSNFKELSTTFEKL